MLEIVTSIVFVLSAAAFAWLTFGNRVSFGRMFMVEKQAGETLVHRIVMPLRVWRKMTPKEYAERHERFGRHVAVSQEVVNGCQEVWVLLGGFIQFSEA